MISKGLAQRLKRLSPALDSGPFTNNNSVNLDILIEFTGCRS
jgi:hypothetical protein